MKEKFLVGLGLALILAAFGSCSDNNYSAQEDNTIRSYDETTDEVW